eukprot:gene4824-4981_t
MAGVLPYFLVVTAASGGSISLSEADGQIHLALSPLEAALAVLAVALVAALPALRVRGVDMSAGLTRGRNPSRPSEATEIIKPIAWTKFPVVSIRNESHNVRCALGMEPYLFQRTALPDPHPHKEVGPIQDSNLHRPTFFCRPRAAAKPTWSWFRRQRPLSQPSASPVPELASTARMALAAAGCGPHPMLGTLPLRRVPSARVLTLGLPHPTDTLTLPAGRHVSVKATVGGNQ